MDFIRRTAALFRQSGELQPGRGMVSGVVALGLALLCLLGVLAFHFPEYLTTPELRRQYSVDLLRQVLLAALLVSGGLALANIVLGRSRWLSGTALLVVLAATALGGSRGEGGGGAPPARPTSAWTGSSSTCSARPWCSC
jgi:hypothetical protein